ncbi:hypothetical protein [Chlorobium sp.]|uniref:hypothetical protein n=1 Tax=Chlorobium sp. TaxID=1095 RepID=UPI003C67142F
MTQEIKKSAKLSREERAAITLQDNWRKTELRTSQSSWAGGYNSFAVKYKKDTSRPAIIAEAAKVWSSNGKWSGNNMRVALSVPSHYWTTKVIGGILTIAPRTRFDEREYKAFWVEQGRGFSVKLIEGFVIRGHHIAGNDMEKARTKVAKIRSDAARLLLKKRHSLVEAGQKWVTIDDSLKAGNCRVGTDAFVKKLEKKLNAQGPIGAVRGDIIIALQDDYYTRRAIAVAEHSR